MEEPSGSNEGDHVDRVLLGPGGRFILVKATGADTGGAYCLLEFKAEAKTPWVNPHIHLHCDEGIVVVEGELSVRIGPQQLSAAAGSYVLIPRGTPHSHSNPAGATTRYLAIFSPAGMEEYFAELDSLIRSSASGLPDVNKVRELNAKYGQQRLDASSFFANG